MNQFKDSVGNLIFEGDLVRMKHFSTNKKKYYMYKIAGEYVKPKDTQYLKFYHYQDQVGTSSYFLSKREEYKNSILVVQRRIFYNDPKIDELKRNTKMKD